VFLGLPSVWKEKRRPHDTNCNDLLTVNADRLQFYSFLLTSILYSSSDISDKQVSTSMIGQERK